MTQQAHVFETVLQHIRRCVEHARTSCCTASTENEAPACHATSWLSHMANTAALLQAAARGVEKVAAVAKRVWRPVPKELAVTALAGAAIVFAGYTVHSVWVRQLRPAVTNLVVDHPFLICTGLHRT